MHPASAVSNHGLPAEDTDRSGQEEIRLLWGKMWTCLTESQVSFFFSTTEIMIIAKIVFVKSWELCVCDISFSWKDWDGGNSAGHIHSGLHIGS